MSDLPGNTLIWVVSDDGGVVTSASSIDTTIGDLALNVANDGTFGHVTNREDVSNSQGGFNAC